MKFALAGNPNCGKTTLFNALTGSTAHVGNWPGVTVEQREGVYKSAQGNVNIIDLPGIYSLSPYTPEEVIARNYILDENPDGIINIVDATNLERNLYLTTQLLEMDVPVVVALNMMDEVEKSGDKIDAVKLEKVLGVPVVEISALKGTGIDALMKRAMKVQKRQGMSVCSGTLGGKIEALTDFYKEQGFTSPLFHAVKLLEGDDLEIVRKGAKKKLVEVTGEEEMMAAVADARYSYIAAHYSVCKKKSQKEVLTKSDKADKVLTNKWAGIPIFLVILFAVFHLTFSEDFLFINTIAGWFGGELPTLEALGLMPDGESLNFGVDLLACLYDGAVFSPGVIVTNLFTLLLDTLAGWIATGVEAMGASEAVAGFINDGVFGGIFAVLGFLPQILVLFLFFSILEDSGYMARVAFILDRIFRKFGLSGRAFMPMIMGFGCSVPATINTRTLADDKERTATIRVIPFFSCGAKLPILLAIGGCVCSMAGLENVDLITYAFYLLGIVSAIVCVLLMRNTTLKGETPPFIMELPTYHMPGFKNLMLHLWDKAKHFVKKAFTIIFASTVIIWLFSHISWSWHYLPDEQMNESILASLGMFIQPIFTPLGFGSQLGANGWVFAVAAVTGLIAKENVIATFGTLAACLVTIGANVDGLPIGDMLAEIEGIGDVAAMVSATGANIPTLLAFVAFNMTTIPCFAAVATAKAEVKKGEFKWTLLFWLVSSYVIAAAVYTIGAWWWTCFIWLAVVAAVTAVIVLKNKGILRFDFLKKRG